MSASASAEVREGELGIKPYHFAEVGDGVVEIA